MSRCFISRPRGAKKHEQETSCVFRVRLRLVCWHICRVPRCAWSLMNAPDVSLPACSHAGRRPCMVRSVRADGPARHEQTGTVRTPCSESSGSSLAVVSSRDSRVGGTSQVTAAAPMSDPRTPSRVAVFANGAALGITHLLVVPARGSQLLSVHFRHVNRISQEHANVNSYSFRFASEGSQDEQHGR